MSFIKDFKHFIARGNVVDLAVAVVLGAAFGQIVTSAVNDLLMPIIGVLLGGIDFTTYKIVLKNAILDSSGSIAKPEVAIKIGNFIQVTINFLLIALFVFVLLKGLMKLKSKKEEAPAAAPKPSEEVTILSEIRDLLKEK